MPRMLAMLCLTFLATLEFVCSIPGLLVLFLILLACGVFK